MKRRLSERERRFCRVYALLRNPKEAALRAGWPPERAEAEALALLARKEAQEAIRAYPVGEALEDAATAGYLRLAFGSQGDAVKLAFLGEEELPEDLEKLDLFGVAEIRRVKGGDFEVKLVNQLEALDRLAALAQRKSQEEGDRFYEALSRAAMEETNEGD